jgi:hypothetical protein
MGVASCRSPGRARAGECDPASAPINRSRQIQYYWRSPAQDRNREVATDKQQPVCK